MQSSALGALPFGTFGHVTSSVTGAGTSTANYPSPILVTDEVGGPCTAGGVLGAKTRYCDGAC
jgi:hypothetical protein